MDIMMFLGIFLSTCGVVSIAFCSPHRLPGFGYTPGTRQLDSKDSTTKSYFNRINLKFLFDKNLNYNLKTEMLTVTVLMVIPITFLTRTKGNF